MQTNDIVVKAHRNGNVELKNGRGRYADVLARGRVSAGAFGWTWCLDSPFEIPFRTGYSGVKTRNEALVAMIDAFIARAKVYPFAKPAPIQHDSIAKAD